MEHFDYRFHRAARPAFDNVPADHRHTLFGTEYVHLKGRQSGDLFVTRPGWPAIESLLPSQWFVGGRFHKQGRALAGATGAVYRVPVAHPARKDFALVVKFSRAAQDTGITVIEDGLALDATERACMESAEFLSPFEEFGNLNKLRAAAGSKIRTAQPLAIYSPPTRLLEWELRRESSQTSRMSEDLLADQNDMPESRRITYEWERLYILLYHWVDGIDAEQARRVGLINKETMISLGQQARRALRSHGWMVADHKPRHVILRPTDDGRSLVRHGAEIPWTLIDYELLLPV